MVRTSRPLPALPVGGEQGFHGLHDYGARRDRDGRLRWYFSGTDVFANCSNTETDASAKQYNQY